MPTNTNIQEAAVAGPALAGNAYNSQTTIEAPLPVAAAVPVHPTMDLDHEPRERLGKALAIFNNCQLLVKYATDNKQVSRSRSLATDRLIANARF